MALKADVVEIPGVGHAPSLLQPSERSVVCEWLQEALQPDARQRFSEMIETSTADLLWPLAALLKMSEKLVFQPAWAGSPLSGE
jgi:hypothetical protein